MTTAPPESSQPAPGTPARPVRRAALALTAAGALAVALSVAAPAGAGLPGTTATAPEAPAVPTEAQDPAVPAEGEDAERGPVTGAAPASPLPGQPSFTG